MTSLELLGLTGTLIVAAAYVPQIVHLVRRRCACGISVGAWSLWLLSALLIFPNALLSKNVVFVATQTVNLLAVAFIVSFAHFHHGKRCPVHPPSL